ncbi:neuromedin-K receptor-like [Neocloeon triangulifer]|uniref:neuromedin-K receptor-like n=1 Tax=Neocloeon triangulifer TaxID=2078957 RepID=UPI00286F6518|nr:neuromedin-K receptor-like [Neocloeon triangulifer]XP_059478227.1 neuromedin-K receptor-like [Neocloeon triangulifer]XP_059478235.1 neuromedin-K receptor-like [Neocloeon triangulifer]
MNSSDYGNFCTSANWTEDAECQLLDNEGSLFQVPTAMVVLLSICYGAISVVAVVGNSLVIWVIVCSRRMQRSATNCFIANLAMADIAIGLFSVPFQFQAALLQRWNLPNFMCAFCPFVQVLSVNVSVFTLTAIAVDRHRAIVKPLRGARPSSLRARLTVASIWVLGGALALPMTIAMRVTLLQNGGVTKPFCYNINLSPEQMTLYRRVLVALQYFVPLCVISAVYVRMGLRLWGSRAPGNAENTRDANLLRNKKRVIKMLVIVVAIFAICWLPLQSYNVLQDIYPQINGYKYINIIWFCCDWLAMSNSCYNPFIYGIYNEKFKREFRQRLRILCPRRQWEPAAENSSVVGADVELSDYDKTRKGRTLTPLNGGSTFVYRSSSVRCKDNVHVNSGPTYNHASTSSPHASNHLRICQHQQPHHHLHELDF